MLGVILCGGESTRMGRDKGLIPAANGTWAGSAVEKMTALGMPVVLSVNERQLTQYASILAGERLITDDPALSVRGPLAGILSVHLRFPTEDLFVLACDLPLMSPTLLQELYLRRQEFDAQAYLYTLDDEPEPLCGIYTVAGLAMVVGLYRSGQLVRHSMKYVLEQLIVDSRPVPGDSRACFRNFNYPNASGS